MEGVGTSTAGFVGLAQRGPVGGVPVLVTNFADFKRKFGGYLSAMEFEITDSFRTALNTFS